MILGIEWLINNNVGYLNIKSENVLILKGNVKLIDYGMKFLINIKIINDFMSPELFKN